MLPWTQDVYIIHTSVCSEKYYIEIQPTLSHLSPNSSMVNYRQQLTGDLKT